MAENKHTPDLDDLRNPNVHHEESDVNTVAISKYAIGLVLIIITSLLGLGALFRYFNNREAVEGRAGDARLHRGARRQPPEPRLQSSPTLDMDRMRAAEENILNGYAWIDPDKGVVRIPIARAMELLAKEGLPSRPQAGPAATDTATVPTESGLGPLVHQQGGPLSANRKFPPDQPLEVRGGGNAFDGRQAGGPPTPNGFALGK